MSSPGRRSSGVIFTIRDRVAYVTLDRPDRMNALSVAVQADLVDVFDSCSTDPEVWAVLLSATGDRAFSAGVDLKEAQSGGGTGRRSITPMDGISRNFFEVVLECAKPTVAAIFGWTLGGGFELALACDLRIAADDTKLGLPEAKRGLGANFGSQLLPRVAPRAIAYQMLYTGEPIDAEAACDWGLINAVVPRAELAPRAESLVRSIVANAPLTTQRYKAMITKGNDLPLAAALRLNAGPNPYLSEDRAEGVAAFLEKRPPQWRGR